MRHLPIALLLLLCGTPPADAHDLWLEPVGERWVLCRGHAPGGHAETERLAYDPGIVQGHRAVDDEGRPLVLEADSGPPWALPVGAAALRVDVSTGVWCKTIHGTRQVSPERAEGVLRSWRSHESVKWVGASGIGRRLGDGLELLCVEDPFSLGVGQKLRLRVIWKGEAAAGVAVAYDGHPRGETDAEGRVDLRIRHGGEQRVSARLTRADPSGELDYELHTTHLQLRLPEEP